MNSFSRPSVLLSCYFPRSIDLEGTGTMIRGLAEAMAEAGWRVRAIVPSGTTWSIADTEVSFVRQGLLGMLDHERTIRRLSPDVEAVLVFANNPSMIRGASASARPDSTFCVVLSPLNSVGLIREMGLCRQALVHGAVKNKLLAYFYNWSQKRCIVASDYQAKQLQRLGAGEIHKMPLVGISRSTVVPGKEEARRRMGWPSGFIIGYLGHFSRAKGVETLVEAFGQVTHNCRLALAHSGKGSLSKQASRKLEDIRRQGRLLEHGKVDSLVFLASCNIVVLPYVTGSIFHLPQVMLESFASSTPVVTTRVGGVAEIVEEETLGLVVPPRSSKALAESINRLLLDQETALQMGRNGRRIFEERLCTEVFVSRFQELMRSSGPASRRKRDAWAKKKGTETYVKKMGTYAVARDVEIIRELIGCGPGRLLDMPCGTGRNFDVAHRSGFRIVGADFSPTMLHVAQEHQDIPLVRADAFVPPFARGAFDVILMPRFLFHYANPETIIASLMPALKPGGKMVFDTLNKFSIRWAASLLLNLFRRDIADRIYFRSPSDFMKKITALDLELIQSRSVYLLPTRLYRFLPRKLVHFIHVIETLVPKQLRVLTYWQVQRCESIPREKSKIEL